MRDFFFSLLKKIFSHFHEGVSFPDSHPPPLTFLAQEKRVCSLLFFSFFGTLSREGFVFQFPPLRWSSFFFFTSVTLLSSFFFFFFFFFPSVFF